MPVRFAAVLGIAAIAVPALATSSLVVTNRVLVERRIAAADGTIRIVASPRARAVPGDRMIVELAYRNTGLRPIADLVLADPVPAALAYRSPLPGSPPAEVSVDGSRFAPLADLAVALVAGGHRAATADDVVAVRWRLSAPLAPGAGGTLSFRAVLR